MTVNQSYNHSLSKVFSPTLMAAFISLDPGKLSSVVTELLDAGIIKNKSLSFAKALDKCYEHLSKNHRSEYIYKNQIIEALLEENHDLYSCAIIPEFRVGLSKADIAVFNGTSSVYEIKTELDSLDRLPSQMADYHQVFNHIYVVTHEKYVERIEAIVPKTVGIFILNAKNELTEHRPVQSNKSNVDQKTMMASLRMKEYSKIISDFHGYVPEVPNTKYYRACEELISEIPREHAHDAMVEVLLGRKLTNHQIELIRDVPYSLRALWVSKRYKSHETTSILNTLTRSVNSF